MLAYNIAPKEPRFKMIMHLVQAWIFASQTKPFDPCDLHLLCLFSLGSMPLGAFFLPSHLIPPFGLWTLPMFLARWMLEHHTLFFILGVGLSPWPLLTWVEDPCGCPTFFRIVYWSFHFWYSWIFIQQWLKINGLPVCSALKVSKVWHAYICIWNQRHIYMKLTKKQVYMTRGTKNIPSPNTHSTHRPGNHLVIVATKFSALRLNEASPLLKWHVSLVNFKFIGLKLLIFTRTKSWILFQNVSSFFSTPAFESCPIFI